MALETVGVVRQHLQNKDRQRKRPESNRLERAFAFARVTHSSKHREETLLKAPDLLIVDNDSRPEKVDQVLLVHVIPTIKIFSFPCWPNHV